VVAAACRTGEEPWRWGTMKKAEEDGAPPHQHLSVLGVGFRGVLVKLKCYSNEI